MLSLNGKRFKFITTTLLFLLDDENLAVSLAENSERLVEILATKNLITVRIINEYFVAVIEIFRAQRKYIRPERLVLVRREG